MTTAKLAKLYGHLTPRERLPMLVAACRREDETERQRLIQTAPRVGYRLPDYHGLADAMQSVMLMHLIERLDLGARFWLLLGVLEMLGATETRKATERADRFEIAVSTMALRFCIEVDGWKLFCASMDLDPDALLACIPAFVTAEKMELQARTLANTPEEAAAYFRAKGESKSARLPTPEEVAQSYRDLLDLAESPWR